MQQDQERDAKVLHVEVARVEGPDGAAVHVPREAGAVPRLLLVVSGRAGSPPALTHPTQARSRRLLAVGGAEPTGHLARASEPAGPGGDDRARQLCIRRLRHLARGLREGMVG